MENDDDKKGAKDDNSSPTTVTVLGEGNKDAVAGETTVAASDNHNVSNDPVKESACKGDVQVVQTPLSTPAVRPSPASIKDALLRWCQANTRDYKNVNITNFSSSWADGMAFCALIHHFCPDAFDFDKLSPENRKDNFDLAFRIALEKADIFPLLETADMLAMKDKPDWKCVFTYIQSIYRRFN